MLLNFFDFLSLCVFVSIQNIGQSIPLNKRFQFQSYGCNRCHALLMMSMNLSDVAILNIKFSNYCCISSRINKSEAMKLMQNIDLTEKKKRTL